LRVDEPERINDDLQGEKTPQLASASVGTMEPRGRSHYILIKTVCRGKGTIGISFCWHRETMRQVLTLHRRLSLKEKARPGVRHQCIERALHMRRSTGEPSSRQRPHLALDRLDWVYDNGHRARVERLEALPRAFDMRMRQTVSANTLTTRRISSARSITILS
jgi:hypothetical protein